MKGATSIQERLWELRKDKGLNLEELSKLTGISKSALGSYEKEDFKEINHGNLITLADFYGVSVDYLLCRTENREQINTSLTELHLNDEMLHLSVNADADHLLASSHQRNTVLGQIALDQIQITGGKGNKAAIGVVADKDNGTGQIPLASQCDDLTRVVTESQRHIVADAVAGICFIEARQVTANVRQRSDSQFNLRGNHSGVNFIIAELPLQHIAHLVKEVGHSSVHVVDLLVHGFDGLCGLEINGSVHSIFLLIFAKRRPGRVLRSKGVSAFILPLLFTLPLIQQLDDGVLHRVSGCSCAGNISAGCRF